MGHEDFGQKRGVLWLLDKSASLHSLIKRTLGTFILKEASVLIFKRQPREYEAQAWMWEKPLYDNLSKLPGEQRWGILGASIE